MHILCLCCGQRERVTALMYLDSTNPHQPVLHLHVGPVQSRNVVWPFHDRHVGPCVYTGPWLPPLPWPSHN
jgi:hypothetical protein